MGFALVQSNKTRRFSDIFTVYQNIPLYNVASINQAIFEEWS